MTEDVISTVWGQVPQSSVTTHFHLCLNIRGCISSGDYKNWVGSISDNGRLLTAREILAGLFDEIAQGRAVIPIGQCDNFDYQTGCRGHLDIDGETP